MAVDATYLPFFDDFAASDTTLRDTLWLYGGSVNLNSGTGIRPPSKNVVSFDGADSLGKPYNINDVLAKGFADRLTSQPIRMDLIAAGDRPSVYFSFYYQLKGLGEPPDPGDQLILAFRAQDGTWENVHTIDPDTITTGVFQQVLLPISDPKYYYDGFQFRFFNLARLSGPYDTWNLDYVYINKGRSPSDLHYPDRTISSPMTSLIRDYFAMPVVHFLEDVAANLVHPTVELYNLKAVDLPGGLPHIQPINYTTTAEITSRVIGVTTSTLVDLDSAQFPGADLPGLQYLTVTLNTVPDPADFDPAADSIHIMLKYGMSTKDNVSFSQTGDYDSALFSPIDFRYNDSLAVNFTLSDYYAYDDGVAEYGAGLNQAGSYIALLYNLKSLNPDTLTYVDIYFPEFGDNTNQSLLLQVRSDLSDVDAAPLLEQIIVVERRTQNQFARYQLTRPVLVSSSFYVGWKQITNASIPVGLDKNTDNGEKIYYSVNGDWTQNTLVQGSLMVRPGFGFGEGVVVTGLEKGSPPPILFPNPSRGVCNLRGVADRVEAFDVTGRPVEARWETNGIDTTVTFVNATGVVVVRFSVGGQLYTQKHLVRP